MPRKRPFSSRGTEDVHLEVTSEIKGTVLNSKYPNNGFILLSNIIFTLYGFSFLYIIGKNENYLYLQKIYFLPVLSFHVALEYLKFHITRLKSVKISINSFLVTFMLSVIICYALTILFGVDLRENIEGTFVFSCMIVTLAVVPLFFLAGKNCLLLILLQEDAETIAQKVGLIVSYSVIAGAWFGAFVIPLDWNRPWQIWPIPCAVGSVIGYVVGLIISCIKTLQLNFNCML